MHVPSRKSPGKVSTDFKSETHEKASTEFNLNEVWHQNKVVFIHT